MLLKLDIHAEINLILNIKVNLRWIMYLNVKLQTKDVEPKTTEMDHRPSVIHVNVKPQTVKLLEENMYFVTWRS